MQAIDTDTLRREGDRTVRTPAGRPLPVGRGAWGGRTLTSVRPMSTPDANVASGTDAA